MADEVPLAEVAANVRTHIIELLRTFSSPDEQREYQSSVPYVNVPIELFCQWADDVYHPEAEACRRAFEQGERDVLAAFDLKFRLASAAFETKMPSVEEFIASNAGMDLADAATAALRSMGMLPDNESVGGS